MQLFKLVSISLFPRFLSRGVIKVLFFLKLKNFAPLFLGGSQEYFGATTCNILGIYITNTIPISYWNQMDIILILIKSYIIADTYADIMLPKRTLLSPNRVWSDNFSTKSLSNCLLHTCSISPLTLFSFIWFQIFMSVLFQWGCNIWLTQYVLWLAQMQCDSAVNNSPIVSLLFSICNSMFTYLGLIGSISIWRSANML